MLKVRAGEPEGLRHLGGVQGLDRELHERQSGWMNRVILRVGARELRGQNQLT